MAAGIVQRTVETVPDNVIGPQDTPASAGKNTFISEAVPLRNCVPEKVKKQIWANEYLDFALLLGNRITNTVEERCTF